MKISQSKVRVEPIKRMPMMNNDMKKAAMPQPNAQKPNPTSPAAPSNIPGQLKKPAIPALSHAMPMKDEYSSLKEAAAAVQRLRLSAQQELELIRNTRADALKYQQETATKARSEAHQLRLHARLETQREIEELIRQASEEIQKVLADIRVIRITAQEELAAQRKFTDAAKLNTMSLSIKEVFRKPVQKKKRKLVVVKS